MKSLLRLLVIVCLVPSAVLASDWPHLRGPDVDGRIAATTADGTLLVPVVADHAIWSAPVAAFAEAVARAAGGDPELAGARVLVSGTLSDRARQEMQGLGIDVIERALEAASPSSE